MPSSTGNNLRRVGKESAEHIARTSESCLDAAEQVRLSRAVIERSLKLLQESPKGRSA
jgi:hypothetical protein